MRVRLLRRWQADRFERLVRRLLALAREAGGESHLSLLEAGAVEWLCALLRRGMSSGRGVAAAHALEVVRHACAAVRELACGPSGVQADVRALLQRCGALELLCATMERSPAETPLQTDCTALVAALCFSSEEPEGVSSHFELMAASMVCTAMRAHAPTFALQRHGCAALHGLSRQSRFIAEEVTRNGGVRLLCKAMRTFRSDSAAAMQAGPPPSPLFARACARCCP